MCWSKIQCKSLRLDVSCFVLKPGQVIRWRIRERGRRYCLQQCQIFSPSQESTMSSLSSTLCIINISYQTQNVILPFLNVVSLSRYISINKKVYLTQFRQSAQCSCKTSIKKKGKNVTSREKTPAPSLIHGKSHSHTSEDRNGKQNRVMQSKHSPFDAVKSMATVK